MTAAQAGIKFHVSLSHRDGTGSYVELTDAGRAFDHFRSLVWSGYPAIDLTDTALTRNLERVGSKLAISEAGLTLRLYTVPR